MKKQGRVRAIGIGSNILDIKTLDGEALKGWDVLQYEGNVAVQSSKIMQKFPDKTHFHHSCLKNRDLMLLDDIAPKDKVGFILGNKNILKM